MKKNILSISIALGGSHYTHLAFKNTEFSKIIVLVIQKSSHLSMLSSGLGRKQSAELFLTFGKSSTKQKRLASDKKRATDVLR